MLLLWSGLYLVLGPLKSPGDGDLYWQRWLGELLLQTHHLPVALGSETFSSAGAPWVPQEWLFSLIAAVASNAHLWLPFALAMSALPPAILGSIYLRARGRAGAEAIGIALLFAGFALLQSFGVRAQVLGWAALAAFMFFLERRDRWQYAAVPTAILWANLHASVAIAPVLVFARLAAQAVDGGWNAVRTGREAAILAGTLAALFCTPFGWRLPAFALGLAHSPIRHFIQEWQPAGLHDFSFTLGALPLALAIAAGGRKTLWDDKLRSFPAAILFTAILFANRNIPLFAIVAAPLAATGMDLRFPSLAKASARFRELERAAVASICVAMLLAGVALARNQRQQPPLLPLAAIASLDDGTSHRLLCENFTWCSVALWYPRVRVFMDGRCDAYPLGVWRQYGDFIGLGDAWRSTLAQQGIDSVVASRASGIAGALAKTPGWRVSFRDSAYVVIRRD